MHRTPNQTLSFPLVVLGQHRLAALGAVGVVVAAPAAVDAGGTVAGTAAAVLKLLLLVTITMVC